MFKRYTGLFHFVSLAAVGGFGKHKPVVVIQRPLYRPFVFKQQYVAANPVQRAPRGGRKPQRFYALRTLDNPAHTAECKLLHANVHAVFVLQAVLKHFELQHAYYADYDLLTAYIGALECLYSALLRELSYALDKLLALHRIHCGHARKVFGRE